MDKPTPEGFVDDVVEEIGKAKAMCDHHFKYHTEWFERYMKLADYLVKIKAWADAGGTGPRPKKPEHPLHD